MLASWVGVPPAELQYTCVGINHLSWYTRLEHKGRDLYPDLLRVIRQDKDIYNQEQVRDMFRQNRRYLPQFPSVKR